MNTEPSFSLSFHFFIPQPTEEKIRRILSLDLDSSLVFFLAEQQQQKENKYFERKLMKKIISIYLYASIWPCIFYFKMQQEEIHWVVSTWLKTLRPSLSCLIQANTGQVSGIECTIPEYILTEKLVAACHLLADESGSCVLCQVERIEQEGERGQVC